jgi:hypothetical protein
MTWLKKFSLVETVRLGRIESELITINRRILKLMAKADEAIAKLDETMETLTKVSGETSELLRMVTELQASAEGNVPDAVMDKINAVASKSKSIDDQVTDIAPPPTP